MPAKRESVAGPGGGGVCRWDKSRDVPTSAHGSGGADGVSKRQCSLRGVAPGETKRHSCCKAIAATHRVHHRHLRPAPPRLPRSLRCCYYHGTQSQACLRR